jgi:glycosyltransferase involved in cell wall biosynthesis
MHNKTPHSKKLNHLQRFLYYLLTQVSDKIVIHSKISKEIISTRYKVSTHKIVYIPHPNYINVYGELHETSQESFSKLRLLSFGAVRHYKNIELLINVANRFNEEIELHIAGNPESKEYKNEITNLAKENKNITLELDFIDDDRMISLLSDYDLVILPYDIRSSLNSGTIILCFSYAKTVIAPEIGTISDVDDKRYLITYKYESPEQHYDMLVEKISHAIKEKHKDTDVFQKWGNKMFAYVEQNNGAKDVQLKFIELYEGIL